MPPSPVLLVPVSRLVFACHCLIVLLPVLSTSRAGRSLLACLVRCGSRLRRLVFLVPPSPCLLALRGSPSPVPILCGRRPVPVVASARVSSSPLVALSPRSSTSGGGAGVGSLLLAHRFALVLVCGFPVVRAACGGLLLAFPGMVGGRCGVGGGLCWVCGVVVCIYKLGACSCMMDIVERKRLRRDFQR